MNKIDKILMLGILMTSLIIGFLLERNLSYGIRYQDDPQTKSEWWDKGYAAGVEAGKTEEFLEGMVGRGCLAEVKKF